MAYQAEYIWLDGYQPTPMLRSKTRILHDEVSDPPIWGFDGSSTQQATGDHSDCVLRPVFHCPDPIRGGRNMLVMCEVMLASTVVLEIVAPVVTRKALRLSGAYRVEANSD